MIGGGGEGKGNYSHYSRYTAQHSKHSLSRSQIYNLYMNVYRPRMTNPVGDDGHGTAWYAGACFRRHRKDRSTIGGLQDRVEEEK